MPIPIKVSKFLEKSGAKCELIEHRTVYTAYDKAATLKIAPKIVGKTLVLGLDKQLVVVLIPANKNLDKNRLRKAAKARKIEFVSERIIKNRIKGVRLGAIPPLGSIWKMSTFIDNSLLKNHKIIINAGCSNWSIKIRGATLKKLEPGLILGAFTKKR